MYSKRSILRLLESGKINIVPFIEKQVESVHVNLHLSEELSIAARSFAVARTSEKLTLSSGICGLIDGKASLAKVGLSIHQSSMLVEPETDNFVTLEIFNASDKLISLSVGQEIAKLVLFPVVTI